MKDIHAFLAVAGYFRSSGYFALQPYLQHIPTVRILVGINVDALFSEAQRKGLLFFGDEEKTKSQFLEDFLRDIREARYDKKVEDGILQFAQDLIDGRIEIRAHLKANIHAKFYLFLPENHSQHSDGWVIMGSSNLTEAGLGVKQSPNYELNVAMKDFDDVAFLRGEFEALWKDSTPILPADIQAFRQKTHVARLFTPYELYLKFLIEYFGKNIDYDPDTVGDLPSHFKKLSYQVEAVNQGYQMLLEHNGFFLADVVGLGKTVVAAMVAKRFLISNGTLNTKILVVYPPALEKNWKTTFAQFGIDKHAKFVSNGRLDKVIDPENNDYWPKEDYDLVIVDEAHRYRNHTSHMFSQLQLICKAKRSHEGLVPGGAKKVMLITATPLNNRPQDLYYQLLLFQDARRCTLPNVNNLQTFFGPLIREYRDIAKQETPNLEAVRALYSRIRERVILPITVRRTRRDLKNYPLYMKDLQDQGIIFPEIADPIPRMYRLEGKLNKLFYQTIFYLTDKAKIQYFRYQAIGFLKDEQREVLYEQARRISVSLAAIMKTMMVKRLESSFEAFRNSLRNMATATARMIEMFERGKVLVAPNLRINDLMNQGYSLDEIEELIAAESVEDSSANIFSPDDFEPAFLPGLRNDLALLKELVEQWGQIKEDPKLEAFFLALNTELTDPQRNPTGKLVIFSESADTVAYLQQQIEARTGKRVLAVNSSNRSRVFETILENFDANFPRERKNDYPVILTTDVLAEGINLHRANVIVNYDTPWNATRLMQRIGRVNRIGSEAGVIYNYNFYPSPQGDEEIRLYRNALVKLQAFHSAFGEDAKIFTPEELLEEFKLFKEGLPDDEDRRLHYLQHIREFKDRHPEEFKRIAALPVKARSCRKATESGKNVQPVSTVVFLKSPLKSEFYLSGPAEEVRPLTFLEAAALLEADISESVQLLPDAHFEQVQRTMHAFERDFFADAAEAVSSTDKSDALTLQARKFLRDVRNLSTREEVKAACEALITLVEQGSYTALPTDLRRMRLRAEKGQLKLPQTEALILNIARKYDAQAPVATEVPQNKGEGVSTSPDVVLSETWV